MAERRYSDDEIAAILKLAAERQQLQVTGGDASAGNVVSTDQGMTLAEVQSIAREVGIPGEMIAQAAGSLERAGSPAVRRYLGLPIGVGRTVSLGRRLTEQDWERLVTDLRETFDARGRLRDEGAFKAWTNGNLQALLEPTASGHRVRLRTLNGASMAYINTGIAVVGMSAVIELGNALSFLHGAPGLMLAGIGATMAVIGAIRLPRWARIRERQMEAIASRLAEDPAPPALPG
jgi:hypothetical protein